ncbi:MAG: DEAD/DEAH box helicase, partial [Alphaproteobacteria bacterium]
MENFSELNLPQEILATLEKMQFSAPTPIQAQAIPFALEGRDILGSAQTGTGKTAAFTIPMVAHMMKSPTSMSVVLTPTRELAVQVMQTIKKLLGHNSPIRTALLIGGENMFRQFSQLEDGARIIVGTPGRINDHLARRSLKLDRADFLILDETDRMLDMGFGVQIDKILTHMTGSRQTLMFSATLPRHIINLAEKYTKNAQRVAVGSTTQPIKAIKQEMIRVSQGEKYAKLTELLDARSGSVIVFVRTKHGADRLAQKLDRENHSADAIHGDLRQNRRDKVIRLFREKKCRILVATDVAARGLDVPHIEHVINYDLPQCPEDYIHRIGRTARAGAEGEAICLVSPEENGKWAAIERLINGGEGSSQPQQGNRGGERRPRHNGGYGRKNEGGFKQDSQRKPHRKGQSWQRVYDEEKARKSASGASDAPPARERDFKPRSERPDREFKPRG